MREAKFLKCYRVAVEAKLDTWIHRELLDGLRDALLQSLSHSWASRLFERQESSHEHATSH